MKRNTRVAKHAKAAFWLDNEVLRAVVDCTSDWENWFSPEGKLLWVNPAVEHHTGYSPAECLAMSDFPMMLVHQADRAIIQSVHECALQGTRGEEGEFRVIRKNGELKWCEARWQPVCDSRGRNLGCRSTICDITKRKFMEAALQQATAYIAMKDAGPVFDEFLKTSVELTGSKYGFFHEVQRNDKADFHTVSLAVSRLSEDATSRQIYEQVDGHSFGFPNLRNLAGATVAAGRLIIANDIKQDTRGKGFPEGHPALQSFMGLPIHFAGELIGVLTLANRPGGYNEDVARFLAPMANVCGPVIHANRREKRESQLTETLRESEIRLRMAMESGEIGMFDWSVPTGAPIWSGSHETLLGRAPGEFNGTYADFDRGLHPDDLAPLTAAIDRSFTEHTAFHCEFRIVRPNDNIRWIAARGEPFYDNTDKPVRMIGVAMDITERRMSEALVRESEERFRRTFDQAPIGAAMVSLDYRFLRVNQALCRITGYTEEQLLAVGFPDITHPDDLSANVEYAQQLAAGKIDQCNFESRYVRSDGDVVWVSLSVCLLRDANDEPLYYLPMIEDISVRKKTDEEHRSLHEQLTHVARLSTLGEMAAGIAHDVNQPLYSIINYAKACRNVLMQNNSTNDKLLQWNEQIAAEADRAGEIIKRMRDLARKAKARCLPTSVHEVVDESLALVAFETRRLRVKVCKEFSETVHLASFDRIQIQQVLVNLLRNAFEALETKAQDERRITIRTSTNGDFVEVAISDNGPGFQDVEAAKVFDAFVTSKPAGLGMGLAISKSIIEAHGGRIWVTGNSEGDTDFHFTVPFTTGERTNV